MMEHLIGDFKGRNWTSAIYLNLLWHDGGKIYIMDNHLAASWCWAQKLNLEENYTLLHVDRHYDYSELEDIQKNWTHWIEDKFNFRGLNIEECQVNESNLGNRTYESKVFRFDNYINIFEDLYEEVINEYIFYTHQESPSVLGNKIETISEQSFDDLLDSNFKQEDKRYILNLDLDYFCKGDGEDFEIESNENILKLAQHIKDNINAFDVITIAMSPDFFVPVYGDSDWGKANRVLEIFTKVLDISFPHDEI